MKRSKKNSDAESQLEQLDVLVSQQNLIHYITLGDTNVVRLLLMAGLNPNAVYQSDKTKWYPLHHSVKNNQLECSSLLLKNGANVNLQDENKQTALFDAIKTGNIDAVRLLIEFGADLNHKGEDKIKPLLYAQKQKKFEIYNLLKESGAEEMTPKEMKVYKIISNTKLVLAYVIVAGILSFVLLFVYGAFFSSNDNNDLTGRYQNGNYIMNIKSDGSYDMIKIEPITDGLTHTELLLNYDKLPKREIVHWTNKWTNEGNKLYITNPDGEKDEYIIDGNTICYLRDGLDEVCFSKISD